MDTSTQPKISIKVRPRCIVPYDILRVMQKRKPKKRDRFDELSQQIEKLAVLAKEGFEDVHAEFDKIYRKFDAIEV